MWMLFERVILKGIFWTDSWQLDAVKCLWIENIHTCKFIFQQLNISHNLLPWCILTVILFEVRELLFHFFQSIKYIFFMKTEFLTMISNFRWNKFSVEIQDSYLLKKNKPFLAPNKIPLGAYSVIINNLSRFLPYLLTELSAVKDKLMTKCKWYG